MRDLVLIAVIALSCAAAVGLAGALTGRLLRQQTLKTTLAVVTVTAVTAVVAGTIGTAAAMFLSPHDFGVVLEVCVVAGAVAVVTGWRMAQRVVQDTQTLQGTARELAAGRTPGVPSVATTELAELGRELVESGNRLTDARRREHALESSRRELVAWVSHDLRTPLAGLRAMAEALEDGVADDPARYHRQMRLEVDRLSAMVDDLFELSRIQSGALALRLEQVSLADVLSDVVAGTQALAQARRVRLDAAASSSAGVVADPRELSRAVTNLVVNAIRHTPADGTVDIVAELGDEHAVLTVQDSCGGIPAAELARVFDVAWRGTASRTPGPDSGAGLGLAIVRGIVEAHAGSVRVDNAGAGCRFEVRLPRTPGFPQRVIAGSGS
jgi:signal transduction histidine kinase